MIRLVLTRLALFVPTLLVASLILFIAINIVPGSAARSALGVDATPQAIMRFEALNGLDRPLARPVSRMARQGAHRRLRPVLPESRRGRPGDPEAVAGDAGARAVRLHRRQSDCRAARGARRLSSSAPCRPRGHDRRDHSRRHSQFLAGDASGARLCSQASPAARRRLYPVPRRSAAQSEADGASRPVARRRLVGPAVEDHARRHDRGSHFRLHSHRQGEGACATRPSSGGTP